MISIFFKAAARREVLLVLEISSAPDAVLNESMRSQLAVQSVPLRRKRAQAHRCPSPWRAPASPLASLRPPSVSPGAFHTYHRRAGRRD